MRKTISAIFGIVLALCFLPALFAQMATPVPGAVRSKLIVFLGDSLTAGFGLQQREAFPALVAEKVHAAGLPFEVQNAGLSGDTSAGALRRVDWLLQRPIDVLVIELGGNDGLRGLPVKALRANLQQLIDKAKGKNPSLKIVIAGMQIPPNLGADYAADFARVFAELARENNATLIPFLLQGVGGQRDLNQSDLIHPNAAGHRIVADLVWRTIEPILRKG